jgi:hypothetical protein
MAPAVTAREKHATIYLGSAAQPEAYAAVCVALRLMKTSISPLILRLWL